MSSTRPRSRRCWPLLGAVLVVHGACSTACVCRIPASNRPAPIGRELIDLDRARRDGLLDDAEYASLRAEILQSFERIAQTPVVPAFPYRGERTR